MPRIQAKNYDVKREFIISKAATLFSKSGYPNARMVDIAEACGASKSMLYHYFPKKENLLMAILTEHLDDVIASLKTLIADSSKTPRDIAYSFVGIFVAKSARAKPRHLVAMLDVKYLPKKDQKTVHALEREIVEITANILKQSNSKHTNADYNMYVLLLIGMINSLDTWNKPQGQYTNKEMADRIAELFLDGFLTTS